MPHPRSRRALRIALSLLMVCLLPAIALAAGESLGQITSIGSTLDGVKVPSGTTLLSPALVTTGDQPAIVQLSSGHVVNLGPTTTAHFEATDDGLVGLAIDEGSAAFLGNDGEIIHLADLGRAFFAPVLAQQPQGQIGEGEATDDVRLCELRDANPQKFTLCTETDPSNKQCKWRELVVPPAEVGNYLNINAVLAGEQEWPGANYVWVEEPGVGNNLGLDRDCKTVGAAFFTTSTAGILIGGVLAGAALYDGIDADETISPVTLP